LATSEFALATDAVASTGFDFDAVLAHNYAASR
jgi:hypothetical protein